VISINEFKTLAIAFPGVTEQPHFDKTSFRTKKKIFATISADNHLACVKLSLIDQSVFCAFDRSIIYPVYNKWGKQGWTIIEIKKIKKNMLKNLLKAAYNEAIKT
jgi:hypothetical protein